MAQKRLTAVGRVAARRAQIFSNSGANSLRGVGLGLLRAESDAVGRRNADGRRAADNHGDDDVGHLFVGCGEHVALFERELGLIDEADALGGPGEGGNHALPVYRNQGPGFRGQGSGARNCVRQKFSIACSSLLGCEFRPKKL